MTDEPRYTLAEARRELEKRECNTQGHRLEILVADQSMVPVALTCSRCGKSWRVGEQQ